MKRIIIIVLILVSGINVSAQKIELGLNGGVTPYIFTDKAYKNIKASTVDREIGYYSSFRVALNLPGWQIGAAVDKFQTGLSISNPSWSTSTKFNSLTPYVFANKRFQLPKSYIYAGINGGMNFGNATNAALFIGKTPPASNYQGYNYGVQAGYTIHFLKGLGANAEAGARHLNVRYKNAVKNSPGASFSQMTFPISLGLRYTF